MGKIVAILVCVVILALLAVGGIVWWGDHSAKALATKEQAVAGNAVVGQGQAEAQTNAIQIQVAGQARDRVDLEVHQDNDRNIEAAPGASQAVDPRLNAVGLRGLCSHAVYRDDPACAPATNGAAQ